jgi:hypothetical protein
MKKILNLLSSITVLATSASSATTVVSCGPPSDVLYFEMKDLFPDTNWNLDGSSLVLPDDNQGLKEIPDYYKFVTHSSTSDSLFNMGLSLTDIEFEGEMLIDNAETYNEINYNGEDEYLSKIIDFTFYDENGNQMNVFKDRISHIGKPWSFTLTLLVDDLRASYIPGGVDEYYKKGSITFTVTNGWTKL